MATSAIDGLRRQVKGEVIKPEDQSENTRAIRAVNEHVAADRRVQSVMLGVADGLTLARKL